MSSKIIKGHGMENISFQVHAFPDISRFPGGASSALESESSLEEMSTGDGTSSPLMIMGVPEEEAALRERNAFQRGLQEAEMRAQQLLAKQEENAARAMEQSLLELHRYQRRLNEECERQVARLATEIAKKIVHHELHADPQIIMAMIRVALDYVADARKVRVRIHPADLSMIQKSTQHGSPLDSTGIPMEWVSDPGMERGGFVVESDMGNVDGRLSQQFQEIERSFFGETK